jgi:hypothetical protein
MKNNDYSGEYQPKEGGYKVTVVSVSSNGQRLLLEYAKGVRLELPRSTFEDRFVKVEKATA